MRAIVMMSVLLYQSLAFSQTNRPIWDLSMLTNSPKWTTLERPISGDLKAIFFTGLPFRGKETRVFAWIGIPKVKPGEKVPAMVLVHGGGGTALEEWVRLWVQRGYAAIAMDTCGKLPVGNGPDWVHDEQGGPPGWGGWDQIDWPLEDQWTYHAVADIILAHSLLRSLPEIDSERVGITGISWGGYLTCIAAGIDRRFRLAVPVYGCGFTDRHAFASDLEKLGVERAGRWMAYWDPSAYLGNADMPFLWVDGSNDFAYTMNALQLSYRLPKGPRILCVRLRMPHGHGPGETPEEIRIFADSILKQGAPLARITGQGCDGMNAWVTYDSKVRMVKAELNYTKDTGRWQDRKWETIPASIKDAKATAELPVGARVYYHNLVDERGCVVSTEHEEQSVH
jgi:dienelactone hydrolase